MPWGHHSMQKKTTGTTLLLPANVSGLVYNIKINRNVIAVCFLLGLLHHPVTKIMN